jgi:hypothetical protein
LEDWIMPENLSKVAASRTSWPHWNMRGRIKRVDSHGSIIEGEYSFGGEHVRISPRFQRGGRHFRVRPERPAVFYAAWCHESSLLPTLLTPEECGQEWALELLDPLWAANKHLFYKLESPFAACDDATQPSHRVGFSFNIAQVLVEEAGSVRSNGTPRAMMGGAVSSGGQNQEALRKRIEELRAKAATRSEQGTPAKPKR